MTNVGPAGRVRRFFTISRSVPDPMSALRPEIDALDQNGITKVAFSRINDPSVIPLWFGEGDAVTPAFIRAAAKHALDDGRTFYTHTRGTEELRNAIRQYLNGLYGIDVHADRITVPGSAMLGVTIAAQTALGRGDHALIVGPVWPNIEAVFQVTGADVTRVRQRLGSAGWALDVDELVDAIRPNTRAVFLNSPCNPTGWMMMPDQQRELLTLCRERNILIIADEVYHRTVFGADHAPSFLSVAEDDDPVVVINGFSKAWAMTGWRLGWVVTPRSHATKWTALSECFNTGSTVFTQPAGIAALEHGENFVRDLQRQYTGGRDIVTEILGDHPQIDYVPPAGAFYLFPRINGLVDSLEFAQTLLAERDVGIAPGYTFGPGNDDHIRICFAQSHERLREGLTRLVAFVEQRFG